MEAYILDENKNPVKTGYNSKERIEFESDFDNKRVAKTSVGDVEISTVFLGLDHGWGEGEPVLFETMVFGGELDQEMERYCTWNEALEGHREMVEKVKSIKED